MIYLDMKPQTSVIRAYDQPGGYEARAPYLAAVTVTHLNDTTGYLQAAAGTVDRETWEATLDLLHSKGFAKLIMERHGEMKTIDLAGRAAGQSKTDTTRTT